MVMKCRDVAPNVQNATNFNVVPDSQTVVGDTLANLKSAVEGETGASAKYRAFSEAAKEAGYDQIARQFACTSEAEQIHIKLESDLIRKAEPDYVAPEPPAVVETFTTDVDLILGAGGEIYETSDMYPSFIQVALDEGRNDAVMVFSRAKLAESVHAELYLDAYNNIDNPDDRKFYLCPICGYIHKGDDFEKCPICFAPKASFIEF